jgi:hypothetical protein
MTDDSGKSASLRDLFIKTAIDSACFLIAVCVALRASYEWPILSDFGKLCVAIVTCIVIFGVFLLAHLIKQDVGKPLAVLRMAMAEEEKKV